MAFRLRCYGRYRHPDFVPGYSSGDHHPAVSHQDAFHVGLGDLSGWSSDRKPGYAVTSVLRNTEIQRECAVIILIIVAAVLIIQAVTNSPLLAGNPNRDIPVLCYCPNKVCCEPEAYRLTPSNIVWLNFTFSANCYSPNCGYWLHQN